MYKFKALKVLFSVMLMGILITGGIFSVHLPSAAATGPIKIMCVGDSCTEGLGDPNMGSYRTELYNLYKKAGINFDFVGSNQNGPSTLPDRDNEGHSGWTIPQVAASINNWINTQNPDVILLWIGGNDLLQTGKINDTGLSNLIDQIISLRPNITIFVSDYYPVPDSVTQYNAKIPGIVQQKASQGKKVYFNKMSGMNFVRSTDLSSDGLHLNVNGYIKAANVWYNTTIDILKSMSGSNSPTPTPPPTNTPVKTVPEDVNGDRAINISDVMLVASHFNTTASGNNYDPKCDVNNDRSINISDIMMIAAKFNTSY
jgi:lysophospholipase L1-like esterase